MYLLSTLTANHWQAITYAFVGARRSHSRSRRKESERLYHLHNVRLPTAKSGCESCNAWLWLSQESCFWGIAGRRTEQHRSCMSTRFAASLALYIRWLYQLISGRDRSGDNTMSEQSTLCALMIEMGTSFCSRCWLYCLLVGLEKDQCTARAAIRSCTVPIMSKLKTTSATS